MAELLQQTIGDYRLEVLLGEGPTGQVFRARHLKDATYWAIKLLHPHVSVDAAFRTDFIRQAQKVAGLRHDHIATIDQWGEQDGVGYLVMELAELGSLQDLLDQWAT